MRDATTGKTSKRKLGTDWGALRKMSDIEIRAGVDANPDAHATDADFWAGAKVVMPRPKQVVTIRLDADLLEWLRKESGYQTRINSILRSYKDAQERQGQVPKP